VPAGPSSIARSCRIGARLTRRDLAATAVPFARSIDGHLATTASTPSRFGYAEREASR
jgi:hypothetical protein